MILQPEKISQRWQARSIGRSLQKLLHIRNAKFVKLSGLRLFLLWYQILNKNRTNTEELMFQKLIQGFDLFHSSVPTILNTTIGLDMLNAEAQKVFSQVHHEQPSAQPLALNPSSSSSSFLLASNRSTIYQFEITPLIPLNPQNEQQLFLMQQQQPQQQSQNQSQQNQFQQQQQQHQHQSSSSQQQSQQQIYQNQFQQQQQLQQHQQANNIYGLTAELLKHMLEFMQQDVFTF